jgi:Ca2+/Na+ antiporter
MYPLDDTFIHMVVAKSVALYGNWGISAGEFQSASSSVLYTLLLAGLFKVVGVHAYIPFLINAVAASILLVVIWKRLRKENIRAFGQLIILLAIIFFTPLPTLVISGMEHTLQCLFSFLFIFGFADWLGGTGTGRKEEPEEQGRKSLPVSIFIYAVLACAIRYEGLFIVAIACLLLLYKRRIGPAFLLGAIGILPILIFGIYSISKGSYFLPNSVLLKSDGARLSLGGVSDFLLNAVPRKLTNSEFGIATTATQYLLIILPLIFLLFAGPLKKSIRYSYVVVMLIFCTFLQLVLAATGWFYRYEAWLMLSSCYIVLVIVYRYRGELTGRLRQYPLAAAFMLLMLFLPMCSRSVTAFSKASQACANIYDQQFQMARFLHAYYDDQVVAVNDIGAVSFYKKEKNLDLWGLANIKIARSKKDNYCTPAFLDSMARSEHAGIAIIFDVWFSDTLRAKWNKVATWTIPNNVICEDSTVSFYAIDKSKTEQLKENLQHFQANLPQGVEAQYY